MNQVNFQANIFDQYARRLSQLSCKNLALLILGAASSAFFFEHDTAIAAKSSQVTDSRTNISRGAEEQGRRGQGDKETRGQGSRGAEGQRSRGAEKKSLLATSHQPLATNTEVAQIPLSVSQVPLQKEGTDSQQAAGDPELGTLRVQEQELSPSPYEPVGHLLGQVGYFQSNNIFSRVDPVGGGLISSGLTLSVTPKLGAKTSLVTAIDGRVIRYLDRSDADYNQLRLRAGIRQQLTPSMFGEIGWNNQKLFSAKAGDRFFNENALRLALQRQDRITDRLWLNSFYEFRLGFADPESRSRMINSLSTDLVYYINPRLQLGLEYQFARADFTQRDRDDTYHLLLSSLTYAMSRDSQLSVQGGFSFGGSSDPNIEFDNDFFSVRYTVDIGRF